MGLRVGRIHTRNGRRLLGFSGVKLLASWWSRGRGHRTVSILPGSWIQAPRTTHPPGTMACPASPLLASLWEHGPSLPSGELSDQSGVPPSPSLSCPPESAITSAWKVHGGRILLCLTCPGLGHRPASIAPRQPPAWSPVSAQQTLPTRQENSALRAGGEQTMLV